MAFKELLLLQFLVFGCAVAQTYKVCISSTNSQLCQSLDRDGSQAVCESVESRVECAVKLARGAADFGVFSEEELLLLSKQQPNDNRVVATIRDIAKLDPYAFEAVAVVPNSHTDGFEGLRGGRYCHPGLDESDLRWSPRVLRTLEQTAARTDRCHDSDTNGKTAEELEVHTLNDFFSAACRPGPWSYNTTVDAYLKTQYPNLCSLCGDTNATCEGYTIDMGVAVSGVRNDNRHIQALECLRRNGNSTVAFVAWQHVREFFTIRNPEVATSFSLLCEDGSLRALTSEILANATSPCALVRQPWSTIIASTSRASEVQAALRTWWPEGSNPGGNTWQSTVFSVVGGANARVIFQDGLLSPANYTAGIRNISDIEASSFCVPARRWCTISTQEQTKCNWVRQSAYTLGIQPSISCQQRNNIFECLTDIRDNQADFIASPSNYGYLARQHYQLSPVKLVQNSRSSSSSFSRVAALIRDSSATNITRFENLKGMKACFPEFGGIAYVAFVKTGQDRSVLSASECDYAKLVGEFFESGSCAPGAVDASHALSDDVSSYNATNLCTACRPAITTVGNWSDFTCAWDYSNLYFGNNGSLRCLADSSGDVAFVEMQNINAQLTALGLQASQFRALCSNNTLAATAGVTVDDNCLLAYVVDSEVLTRRNEPLTNSLNTLLDTLDHFFGYTATLGTQLVNLEIYSPFDGISDLLFKNSAIGLSEPSSASENVPAKNYIDLFSHLESCTGAASPMPGLASRNLLSIVTLIVMALFTKFIIY